ncbi:MAG TPA: hypothetical protein VGL83_07795 [Stellaceae bacterium]
MKKPPMVAAAAGVVLLARVALLWASEPLDLFDSEAAARKHCGKDAVVWLDVPSKTFWAKGQKGYGHSKSGGYTCRKDAVSTGNHANRR